MGDGVVEARRGVVARAVALTWLNPHVYLDTVLLLGSIAGTHGTPGRWWFALGACVASIAWFAGLGYGARLAAPRLASPRAWQVLDVADRPGDAGDRRTPRPRRDRRTPPDGVVHRDIAVGRSRTTVSLDYRARPRGYDDGGMSDRKTSRPTPRSRTSSTGASDARRRDDARVVLDLMREVTGAEPVVWGPSMIGFGRQPYTTADGKEHEWFAVGLAPRKAALTLYGLTYYGSNEDLLERLGPHTTGKGCVYVKRSATSTARCSPRWSSGPGRRTTSPGEGVLTRCTPLNQRWGRPRPSRATASSWRAWSRSRTSDGVVVATHALVAGDGGAGGHAGQDPGQAEQLPHAHAPSVVVPARAIVQTSRHGIPDLDQAVDLTRSGDIWLFRGRRAPDRAIRAVTNSPVNHVGMAVVVDDLPPLIFHAELGKKQIDMWTGDHHRGVQLHDLREAVARWQGEYRPGRLGPPARPADRPSTRRTACCARSPGSTASPSPA